MHLERKVKYKVNEPFQYTIEITPFKNNHQWAKLSGLSFKLTNKGSFIKTLQIDVDFTLFTLEDYTENGIIYKGTPKNVILKAKTNDIKLSCE